MKKIIFLFIFLSIILSSCLQTSNKAKKLTDSRSISKLFKAIMSKNYSSVKNALKKVDANSRSSMFVAELVKKIDKNNTKIFLGLKKNDSLSFYKNSALHVALFTGYKPVIKLLIENGANVNEIVQDEVTLVFLVIYKQNLDILKLFIQNGVNLKVGRIPVYFENKLNFMNTLEYAQYLNSAKEVIDLIKKNIK